MTKTYGGPSTYDELLIVMKQFSEDHPNSGNARVVIGVHDGERTEYYPLDCLTISFDTGIVMPTYGNLEEASKRIDDGRK